MGSYQIKEVEQITQKIYNDFCHRELETWFDVLHKDCVWVGSGEPTLVGAEKIKDYFSNYPINTKSEVISETYSTVQLNSTSYIVTGNVLVGVDISKPTATVLMTMVYRYIHNTPKLTYQHMSYDFVNADISENLTKTNKSNTDLATRLLIRQTLLTKEHIPPIRLKVGQQIYYVSPASIIYLQSNRHKTSVYCIDKVLECSMLITDIEPLLPDNFYFLRRGCIVNTMYITAVRRCEIELVFGTTIQVPAANFTTAKKEINDIILMRK